MTIAEIQTVQVRLDSRRVDSVTSVVIHGQAFASTGAVEVTEAYSYRFVEVAPTPVEPLSGERHPALVRVWDNDDDAIYDQI